METIRCLMVGWKQETTGDGISLIVNAVQLYTIRVNMRGAKQEDDERRKTVDCNSEEYVIQMRGCVAAAGQTYF